MLLPDADRHVLEMAFFEGKTSAQISDETGFPVDTISSRLVSALSVLRNRAVAAPDAAEDTGLEVLDLDTSSEFTGRNLHMRDIVLQMEGLRRLTHSFVQSPDTILRELVNAAVDLCGADSAGISLETEEKSDANYYHWVATAGQYNGFLNAGLQRYPSACGKATASAEMANRLAHKINNPLRSLMQIAYLAAEGESDQSAETLGQELSVDLQRLSALVTESLVQTADDAS